MALFNRYESCWGLTLFRWFNKRVEIWFCAPGYKIIEHRHPMEDVELMFIFGQTIFHRRSIYDNIKEDLKTNWRFFLLKFTVKHYHYHWFEVGKLPLIFINFQTFLNGAKPQSAAKDFLVIDKTIYPD